MRDSQISISKSNIIYNYDLIKKRANNCEIAPVIKANAFGHGLELMAKVYQEIGNRMVTVAYVNEAKALRDSAYKNDILLLVPPVEKDIESIIDLDLETTLAEEKTAFLLNEEAKRKNKQCKVHIFVNTGMNREGKKPHKVLDFIKYLRDLKFIQIEGILSHFAASDIQENLFNNYQLKQFKKVVSVIEQNQLPIPKKHIHNSASIFNYLSEEDKAYFDICRPGIASYGLLADKTQADKIGLKPILELKTKVHHLIEIQKGETCGYNFQYTAEKSGRLAIIPIGFGDGIPRNLTDKMQVIIKDKLYDVVGFVSMDLIIINIENDDIQQGDDVILIGKSPSHEISVYDLADKLNTITYEITTNLSNRLPRLLV